MELPSDHHQVLHIQDQVQGHIVSLPPVQLLEFTVLILSEDQSLLITMVEGMEEDMDMEGECISDFLALHTVDYILVHSGFLMGMASDTILL